MAKEVEKQKKMGIPLSVRKKKKIIMKAVRKHRGKLEEKPRTSTFIPSTPLKTSPGRPTITGAIAMTPIALRNRKKYVMKEKRKKEKHQIIG